jgi:hypothetical protein
MTGPHDDVARLRRDFASDPAVPLARETCPQPETLWAALHGELSPAEIREVVDHTASCPACAEDWRLAMAMEGEQSEDEEEDEEVAATTRPWRRWAPRMAAFSAVPAPEARATAARAVPAFRSWMAAAAAAAVLLVAVGIEIGRVRDGHVYRGSDTVRSLIADGETLPREACRLTWLGPAGAIYSVEVRTFTGQVVASTQDLPEQSYSVPKTNLAGIPPESRLEWQVTARLPSGEILRSPLANFILQ